MALRWAVFLDRDGTINEEVGYVSRPEQLSLLPGACAAIKRLKAAGALLVAVTNQPVVARGLIDEAGLRGIHQRLAELLRDGGAELDGVYYCPHHPERGHAGADDPRYRRDCPCRKPKPGLLTAAAGELGIDLSRSFIVGDSTRDIAAGHAAGCRAVLVRTGHGGRDGCCPGENPDAVVDSLPDAAEWILSRIPA